MRSGRPLVAVLERTDLRAIEQQVRLLDPMRGAHVARFGELRAVVVPGISSPFVNRIYGVDAAQADPLGDLDRAFARYRATGITPVGVMVSEATIPSAQLTVGLTSRGFTRTAGATKLWRRIDRDEPSDPSGQLVIEASTDAALIASILVAGYGQGAAPAWWYVGPVGAPSWRHFVACQAGTPVGAAALCIQGRVCWFGYAATVPSARRRGVQRALIAERIRWARSAGCTVAVAETAARAGSEMDQSHRNLAALGFLLAYHRSTWTTGQPISPSRASDSPSM